MTEEKIHLKTSGIDVIDLLIPIYWGAWGISVLTFFLGDKNLFGFIVCPLGLVVMYLYPRKPQTPEYRTRIRKTFLDLTESMYRGGIHISVLLKGMFGLTIMMVLIVHYRGEQVLTTPFQSNLFSEFTLLNFYAIVALMAIFLFAGQVFWEIICYSIYAIPVLLFTAYDLVTGKTTLNQIKETVKEKLKETER